MKYRINKVDFPGIIYYNDQMSINYNMVHKFEDDNSEVVSEKLITKDFPIFDYFKAKDKLEKIFKNGSLLPRSFFVREDLLEELLKFSLPKYIILDVKIMYRKKWIENYKAIFLEEDMIKYADFLYFLVFLAMTFLYHIILTGVLSFVLVLCRS